MPNERSKIIIREIHYWKEHNLLPEVYCDFLLSLYTQGERKVQKISPLLIFNTILLLPLIPISLVVIYHTEIHPILQIGILTLFLTFSIWSYKNFKNQQYFFSYLALVIVLILILLLSLCLAKLATIPALFFPFIILMNFISWLIIGYKRKHKLLKIKGILALIFTSFYIIL